MNIKNTIRYYKEGIEKYDRENPATFRDRLAQVNEEFQELLEDKNIGCISYWPKYFFPIPYSLFPVPCSLKAINFWLSSKLRCTQNIDELINVIHTIGRVFHQFTASHIISYIAWSTVKKHAMRYKEYRCIKSRRNCHKYCQNN